MLHYAMRLDESDKTLSDIPSLAVYEQFYGFTTKDLGLYALVEHQIAGAVWIRRLNADHGANGYIDDTTPIMTIAVLPEFRGSGIGSAMMEQLFSEAGALHEQISVSVVRDSRAVDFYLRHGFETFEAHGGESPVDGAAVITMVKKLARKPIIRPTDGYDPRRWLD